MTPSRTLFIAVRVFESSNIETNFHEYVSRKKERHGNFEEGVVYTSFIFPRCILLVALYIETFHIHNSLA